jgi:hypothetical protein
MALAIRFHLEIKAPPAAIRAVLATLMILATVGGLGSQEQVQMTVYYPAPSGAYQQLLVNQNAYLATQPNQFVDVGGFAAPAGPNPPQLMVVSGNMAVGVTNASPPAVSVPGSLNGRTFGGLLIATNGYNPEMRLDSGATTLQFSNAAHAGGAMSMTAGSGAAVALSADPTMAHTGFNVASGGVDIPPNANSYFYSSIQAPYIDFTAPTIANTNVLYNCQWIGPVVDNPNDGDAQADCPSGMILMGGGGSCPGAVSGLLQGLFGIIKNGPMTGGYEGWETQCSMLVDSGSNSAEAYALCCQ